MKKLTKVLCATLLFAAPLPAFAQGMPVHDSASLVQQINAVRQAIQIVEQGKAQIAEAQKLYQDLNKLTDIPRLAERLKSDALRELATRTKFAERLVRNYEQQHGRIVAEKELMDIIERTLRSGDASLP